MKKFFPFVIPPNNTIISLPDNTGVKKKSFKKNIEVKEKKKQVIKTTKKLSDIVDLDRLKVETKQRGGYGISELKDVAKELGISKPSIMGKKELLKAINFKIEKYWK